MALKSSIPRFAPRPIKTDICVIGAGIAGFAVATAAAQLGLRTILLEREMPGGSNHHTGSLPSAALIEAAREVWRTAEASPFRPARRSPVDFAKIRAYVDGVVAAAEPNISAAHCEALGVRLIKAQARFRDRRRVMAGNQEIRAHRFVIATGSRPALPTIPGLSDVPFFTSDNFFSNDVRPDHLIVIGGGPFGIEMAQASRRLGSRVTLIDAGRILSSEDPELTSLVAETLRREGVEIWESTKITGVTAEEGRIVVSLRDEDKPRQIRGTHLLIAAGRLPNVETLHLDRAGIVATPLGIKVDDRMRTANRRVFALGDVVGDVPGGNGYTHVAAHQVEIVLKNALFRLPARADYHALPRVTYCDPELACAGLSETEARARAGKFKARINVLRWQFAENDRARAAGLTNGVIKVITDRHSRILGVSIFAPQASELIVPWLLAQSKGLKLSSIAGLMIPYPTLSEISKRVASTHYLPSIFSERTRSIVRFLRFWP